MNLKLVFLFLGCLLLASCGDELDIEKIEDVLTKKVESSNYNYFMSESDNVDTVIQEKIINWLLTELNIQLEDKIQYYKIKDRNQMEELTNMQTNGFAIGDENSIFSIWRTDMHESLHILMAMIGANPPVFFNEGFAVCFSGHFEESEFVPLWNGEDYHLKTKSILNTNLLPSLDNLLGEFRTIKDQVSYPISGSFMRYLVEKHGVEKLKSFFQSVDRESPVSETKNAFKKEFKISLQDEWNSWIEFIEM